MTGIEKMMFSRVNRLVLATLGKIDISENEYLELEREYLVFQGILQDETPNYVKH